MAGRRPPPLAQSTFDNMGAEASALRESLVNSKLFKRRKIFANDKMKTWKPGKLKTLHTENRSLKMTSLQLEAGVHFIKKLFKAKQIAKDKMETWEPGKL